MVLVSLTGQLFPANEVPSLKTHVSSTGGRSLPWHEESWQWPSKVQQDPWHALLPLTAQSKPSAFLHGPVLDPSDDPCTLLLHREQGPACMSACVHCSCMCQCVMILGHLCHATIILDCQSSIANMCAPTVNQTRA